MRLVAILLLLAHSGALAAPAVGSEPIASDGYECAIVPVSAGANTVEGPMDCEGCEMPNCEGMLECMATAFALPASAKLDMPASTVIAGAVVPVAVEKSYLPAPTPPPPEA